MRYQAANQLLPPSLLRQIQQYIDGEYLYIPRLGEQKKCWGSNTTIRKELEERNRKIYTDYCDGHKVDALSEKYFLSEQSIRRILGQLKKVKR